MGAGSLLTGLAIYKPVQAASLTALLGGYPAARLEHFALTVGYVLFFVIHITQVVRAGWNNFRAMVIGAELALDEDPPYDEFRIERMNRPPKEGEPLEAPVSPLVTPISPLLPPLSSSTELTKPPLPEVPASSIDVERRLHHMTPARFCRRRLSSAGRSWSPAMAGLERRRCRSFLAAPSCSRAQRALARGVFSASGLSNEFPRSAALMPRVNGQIGLDSSIDPAAWRLSVVGVAKDRPARLLTLADVKALPRVEMTTELRCIEGWSTVVSWAGARLADLAAVTGLATRSGRTFDPRKSPTGALDYVALETPNGEYYVGLEMASALHPQTLLCYEMDGRPLTPDHGAPLRLVIPVKYGIKNLKQIGTIRFTDLRPADYWAERGYDWYAGH